MDASQESQPSATPASEQIDPADCFKILLATDIHLGYKEKDLVIGMNLFLVHFCWCMQQQNCVVYNGDLRLWFHSSHFSVVFAGKDSFIAFEEILYYAEHHQVDFVLLGGDLFHDTNPSKEALHKYDITDHLLWLSIEYKFNNSQLHFTRKDA